MVSVLNVASLSKGTLPFPYIRQWKMGCFLLTTALRVFVPRSHGPAGLLRPFGPCLVAFGSTGAGKGSSAQTQQSPTHQEELPEPKAKALSIIDALPGNSLISRTGYVTLGAGIATYLVSKEIYVMNEESLLLICFASVIAYLYRTLREPYATWATNYIDRMRNILVEARAKHKEAVAKRAEDISQLQQIVDVTKQLYSVSKDMISKEAQNFELQQQVALSQEIKAVLDSWVRHEATIREQQQQAIVQYMVTRVKQELQDPQLQAQLLSQAITEAQALLLRK